MTAIQANTKVRYKAEPTTVGWVIGIEGDNARVFIDGSTRLVPLTELEAAPGLTEMSPDQFRVALTRRRLEHPLTEQLLSYRASKTQLYYHQFLPVKKMLESPDQRLLIADEVGTGKTIEAGLIWAELEARAIHGLENIWVICPKALVGKWQEEMLQRFDFRLEPLSSEGLRQALVSLDRDGVLPPRFAKCVVNLELIRGDEHVTRLGGTSIGWDFVIFDEAHHLRNPETLSYALARFICERSKTAIFLTATPLQTGLEDIVHLMEALGVDVAADPRLLEEQIRWDMGLNDWIRLVRRRPPDWQRELHRMLDNLENNGGRDRPGWSALRALAVSSDLEDIRQRTSVIQAAQDLQVLSPYMTRTLRSDFDVDRPTREVITRIVRFSPAEESLYREVYRICLERARAAGVPPGFATQMPERRTASCVPAVASEVLRYTSENAAEEFHARFTPAEVRALEPHARAVIGSRDSKFDALGEILEYIFGELKTDRVMIFSTFRGTLHYLTEKLREKGYSLSLMYGDTPVRDEDCRRGEKSRERIAAEFRRGDFQILLASEVAGEGLDFEHCHAVINYDLPWNPMRVEQRIGRCDRLGQRSDKVYVGNLASTGTIEERILSRLYQRLQIFERALGGMELILGEQIASFERDVFKLGLSAEQQEERLERIAQAAANIEQQRESITESSGIFLAGRQLIESEQEDIKEAEAGFLSPSELADFVVATIDSHYPNSIKKAPPEGTFEVTGTRELRDALRGLLRAYPASHYARTEIVRFGRRLEEGRTKIVFWGESKEAEFAHIRHPLVLLARWLEKEPLPDVPYCTGIVPVRLENPTVLVWAVGSLEGYTNRVELLCATVGCSTGTVEHVSPQEAQEFIRTLSPSGDRSRTESVDLNDAMTQAEKTLLNQFEQVTEAFNSRNSLLREKAKQAVTSHAERKLTWLRRQLGRRDLQDNIRNLYRGWSQRLEAETKSKLEDIEQKSRVRSSLQTIGVVVMHADPVKSR